MGERCGCCGAPLSELGQALEVEYGDGEQRRDGGHTDLAVGRLKEQPGTRKQLVRHVALNLQHRYIFTRNPSQLWQLDKRHPATGSAAHPAQWTLNLQHLCNCIRMLCVSAGSWLRVMCWTHVCNRCM